MVNIRQKFPNEYYESIKDNEDGKLILVTAINPTPAGEGKTTVTVGLGEAFGRLNKKADIALREPHLDHVLVSRVVQQVRVCTGCTNGRFKPSLYRRFSCYYISK